MSITTRTLPKGPIPVDHRGYDALNLNREGTYYTNVLHVTLIPIGGKISKLDYSLIHPALKQPVDAAEIHRYFVDHTPSAVKAWVESLKGQLSKLYKVDTYTDREFRLRWEMYSNGKLPQLTNFLTDAQIKGAEIFK